MRTVLAVIATCAVLLSVGCAARKAASAEIVLQKWEGFDHATQYKPLDKRMQQLAVDAEMTYIRRLRGQGPQMFDDTFMKDCLKTVYVLSDLPLTIEPGAPNFVVAKDMAELERLARETKKHIYYIELKTLGQTKVKGKTGVAVSYEAFVVDWEAETWQALPESEKAGKPKPQSTGWLYGCWVQAFVTRSGGKLLVLEGPMIVS